MVLGEIKNRQSSWGHCRSCFPKSVFEKEILWIIGTTVHKFWTDIFSKDSSRIKDRYFFGYMRFKYREHCWGSTVCLKNIPGLNVGELLF